MLQWHVKAILYRAKAYVRSHLQLKLNAREVDAVQYVASWLPARCQEFGGRRLAGRRISKARAAGRREGARAGLRPGAAARFFLEHEEGAVVGGLVRTMSVLGLMQGGHTNSSLLASMSRSQLSARSLLRNSGSHSSPVAAESKDESPSKVAERLQARREEDFSRSAPRAAKEVAAPPAVPGLGPAWPTTQISAQQRELRRPRATSWKKRPAGRFGDDSRPLTSATTTSPRSGAYLHAFKDEVGGAALMHEVELDAAVCVETLHALATAAFPALAPRWRNCFPRSRRALSRRDADFAVKAAARS